MKRRSIALIDEARCIGCARCLEACPVDAIAGAQGFVHTVITDYCVGCELCLPPCPVDCIDLAPPPPGHSWGETDARGAKFRHRQRRARLARAQTWPQPRGRDERRKTIAEAIARAAARRVRSR